MDFLELTVSVRQDATEAAADVLRRHVPAGVSIEPPFEVTDEDGGVAFDADRPVRMRAWLSGDHAASRPTLAALRADLRTLGNAVVSPLRTRTVSDTSWAETWKRHFPVLHIGRRLVVRPAWRRYRPRRSEVVVVLDPGLAFGTGQHPTTRMCLEALEERLSPGSAVLDLGCGSGLLSAAAALLGAGPVDAVDIDPNAVQATVETARRSDVEALVRVAQGSLGEAWPFAERAAGRYDLVLANLSANVIEQLAAPLVAALRPAGVALVSGVIDEREADCRAALDQAGGRVVDRREDQSWLLLAVVAR